LLNRAPRRTNPPAPTLPEPQPLADPAALDLYFAQVDGEE
jgi:hypothetical protein